MNTPNNKRKRESIELIEKTFIDLIQFKELNQISVSEICKKAGLNRTTFYANYTDIYALADSIRDKLENNLSDLYEEEITQRFNSHAYIKLFRHIKENQIFYKTSTAIFDIHFLKFLPYLRDFPCSRFSAIV